MDIKDMSVMELIEEITETTKIAALNLWGTNRDVIDECAQKMKDIRLKANTERLDDAFDNIEVAFRAMEDLTKSSYITAMSKSVKDIVKEMLDNDVSDSDSD